MRNASSFLDVNIFSHLVLVGMKVLVWLVLLVTVLLIFFPRPGVGRFRSFELEAHPYSGLDPQEWKSFLTELRAFDANPERARHLYGAIEHLRNLGLMNTNYTESVNEISDRLGFEGETIANQIAQARGVQFRPKYLNDTIPLQSIDDHRTGAPVGSGFPDPRSHGQ
jgi:hypothetical protein